MMYGGLRLGEACAITRSQLSGDRLLIDRQVLEFGNVRRLAPVKSGEGYVVIPEWLVDPVLHTDDTVSPMCVRASLIQAGNKHGFHLNPHMLRKWHGTWLLNKGVNIVAVSKQLRHSSPSITLKAYIMTNEDDVRKAF